VVGIMTTCFVVNDELSRKDEWKFCALRRNRKTRIGSLDVGPQPVPHPVRSGSRARDPQRPAAVQQPMMAADFPQSVANTI
jgi:hypothetical protein